MVKGLSAACRLPAADLRCPERRAVRGFTLIELIVVVIILGVIAAIAVPRYIALGQDARVASLKALAGVLASTANNVRAACALSPACDINNADQHTAIAGRPAWVNYGWLNAGDDLNNDQIDAWVSYMGFTASLPDGWHTKFALDGAPDPGNCAVIYTDSNAGGGHYLVTVSSSGC